MILDFAVITVVNGQNVWKILGGVSTTDARLSDARVPLPHTHNSSDIVGLPDPNLKEDKANKNAPSGYAGLDASTRLSGNQQRYGADAQTACEGNDARLSDARIPTGPASGDLAGTFPAPTVTGLQGAPLAAPIRAGFITRSLDNTTWVQTDDVAPASELAELRDNFRKLLRWVIESFGTLPPGLEQEFELSTNQQE